jgi:hypothetical protein
MSGLKAALGNLNRGIAAVEELAAQMAGHLEQLRQSNHGNANAISELAALPVQVQELDERVQAGFAELNGRLDALFSVLGVTAPERRLVSATEVTSNGKRLRETR